ncbi:PpiC-type peptidyl-prolyl cis-trans isomerase [uncultured Desulfobacterium sp.]|uniref:PpiC-type peptidyl-prolyl cis-trans isomerase n=1 Tax=uncultured Desulfobacterium sp. TaxID=201089 RepID=A0A445N064_9BACT|nr:PpiC-type peptidyl-prolyl cis-trans isomerase [uncultured Desulfobacterium sp.]
MKILKKRLFFALAAFVGLTSISLSASAVEDKTPAIKVAVVNGSVITKDDFEKHMSAVQQQMASMGKSLNNDQLQSLKNDVLEEMIDRELLYQESKNNKVEIGESEVKEQLDMFKKQFPNEDEFKKELSRNHLSEDFIKSQIRQKLAIEQMIDKQIGDKITVSDEETKAYYNNNPQSFKKPEQVRASHILIKVDAKADEAQRAQARKKIEEIQQRIKKGEDFAALAKELSQCPSAAKGGDLGYFSRGQMTKPFEDAAFAMAPGEVSNIVETDFGFHLIKIADKKPESVMAYEDIKDRLGQYLKQIKIKDQVKVYVGQLKEKAKVERLLKDNP